MTPLPKDLADIRDTIADWVFEVEFSGNRRFRVPVFAVALSRAAYYAKDHGGDVGRSLLEETLPLFAEDEYEVSNWARSNMNWADVKAAAVELPGRVREPAWEEEWCNAPHRFGGPGNRADVLRTLGAGR